MKKMNQIDTSFDNPMRSHVSESYKILVEINSKISELLERNNPDFKLTVTTEPRTDILGCKMYVDLVEKAYGED